MRLLKQAEHAPELLDFLTNRSVTFSSEHVLESIGEIEDVKIEIVGEFDAVKTFQQVYDAMPPIGSFVRITLDFSKSVSSSLTELSYFLIEMAWHPRFEQVGLSFEGLQF